MKNDDFRVADEEKCAICIDDLANKDYLKIKTEKDGKVHGCGHMFHKECVKKWLSTACVCPLCRCELPVEDNEDDITKMEERYIFLHVKFSD